MPERFAAGIDGGQTGTTCLIAATDGSIVGRGLGGHLRHLAQPGGPAQLRQALAQSVAAAWRSAGLSPQPCAAAMGKLNFRSPVVSVAPMGGVFRAGAIVLQPFRRRLWRLDPRARVVRPALPAVCGSALLALRACGALDDSVARRLLRQARKQGWASIE